MDFVLERGWYVKDFPVLDARCAVGVPFFLNFRLGRLGCLYCRRARETDGIWVFGIDPAPFAPVAVGLPPVSDLTEGRSGPVPLSKKLHELGGCVSGLSDDR